MNKQWDEYTHLPNYAAMLGHLDTLDLLLAEGRLTEDNLEARMGMYYDSGDYIPQNVGAGWIWRLTERKHGMPEGWDAQFDIEAFLRRHFDTPHVIELFMAKIDKIMASVETSRLRLFVYDAYIVCGARNNFWIKAALRANVPRETIASAIEQRLLNKTESRSGMADCVYDFVRKGAGCSDDVRRGYFTADTPWGVFDDHGLERVLIDCARKRPGEVARMMKVIKARLGQECPARVFETAVVRSWSISGFSLDDLRSLPLEARKRLCARFQPDFNTGWDTVRFIVDTAMAIGGAHGGHFFGKTIERTLYLTGEDRPDISPPTVYRACRSMLVDHDDAELKDLVQAWCELILTRHGYVVGVIEEGRRHDRRTGREMRQMQVTGNNGHRYVQERGQHRYFPEVGDVVMFSPNGLELTPYVTAVRFIPAASTGDHPNEASY